MLRKNVESIPGKAVPQVFILVGGNHGVAELACIVGNKDIAAVNEMKPFGGNRGAYHRHAIGDAHEHFPLHAGAKPERRDTDAAFVEIAG